MKNKRKWVRHLLTAIVAILLIVMLTKVDIPQLLGSISQLSIGLIITLMGIQLISELLLVIQWCRIARLMDLPVKFSTMLFIIAKGTVMEAVTPGAKVGGEVVKGVLFHQRLGYSPMESASLVGVQKLISMSALIGMGLLATLIAPKNVWAVTGDSVRILVILALSVSLLFLLALLFKPKTFRNWVANRTSKLKWINTFYRWIEDFSTHLQLIKGKRWELFLQYVLAVAIWSLFPYKLLLLTRSLGLTGSVLGIFATTLVSYLVAMIPLLPGGLGSFEVTMTAMLVALGMSNSDSMVASVSFRFITFWFVVAVSVLVIIIDTIFERRKEYEEKTKQVSTSST